MPRGRSGCSRSRRRRDFLDGRIARAAAPGRRAHGAVLDNVADIAFVLAATGAGAALGLVPWAAPLAIARRRSAAYALASVRRTRAAAAPARSRSGTRRGVANYALAGLVAGAVALPGAAWRGRCYARRAWWSSPSTWPRCSTASCRAGRLRRPPARATPGGGSTSPISAFITMNVRCAARL